MDDLEAQILTLVQHRTAGVDPVTVEEVTAPSVRALPDAAGGDVRRGRWALGVAAAIAVLVAAGAVAVRSGSDPTSKVHTSQPTTTVPDGWRTLTVPNLGWTVEAPSDWGSNLWNGSCDGSSGLTVTNDPVPFARTDDPSGCTTTWDADALARTDLVALAIVDDSGATDLTGSDPEVPHETVLPLNLDDLEPHDRVAGEPELRTIGVSHGGQQYNHLEAWIGDDAPAADVAVLERVIASIRYGDEDDPSSAGESFPATGSPRLSTFLACMSDRGYAPTLQLDGGTTGSTSGGTTGSGEPTASIQWGPADEDRDAYWTDHQACWKSGGDAVDRFTRDFAAWPGRSGPSQSRADAERDGVLPEVADLPLSDRAVATRWADTRQGTWAITRMPDAPGGAADADGCLGDRTGNYGTDFVCAGEYGEVVLVDHTNGSVLRAYPLPGLLPTWLHVTRDAVYAGRVGDGGLPDAAIIRIDRGTLQSKVLVFPAEEREPVPNGLDPAAMGWTVATPDASDAPLVGVPDLPGGTIVDSTIGVTRIDLPAIEDRFR